jgi:uncharacterized protein
MTPQAGRDLIWAINSPSLIRSPADRDEGNSDLGTGSECREIDLDIDALESRLNEAPTRRVGHYFEQLIHYYLEEMRGLEIVAHGLQIHEGGRTTGEIDFLYRDEHGSLCHLEAAVKFYLYLPDSNELDSQFIGPNAADTFERKMGRLFSHQLRLSEGRFPEVLQRHAFVKGRIFYHPLQPVPASLPDRLSHAHLRGSWICQSELDLLDISPESRMFRVLKKPHWLAPEIVDVNDTTLQSLDEIQDRLRKHFAEQATPLLLSVLTKEDRNWQETDRVFVVSDSWPRP